MAESRTFVTRLTPPGSGAIGVLAVEGPAAWELVRQIFRPVAGSLPAIPEIGQTWVGVAGTEDMADECVLVADALMPVPRAEIHCHGGKQVVAWLEETLQRRGAIVGEPSPSEGDPLWRLVEQAPTARTAAILLDQAQGAWVRERATLTELWQRNEHDELQRRLEKLENWIELGQHLVQPWRVVVAGVPNVGKSSLVNALTGFHRSIVSEQAGTTRDVVGTRLALDGWPVELLDTAGWQETTHGLEQAAIRRAREAALSADLVLWVEDHSQPVTTRPREAWRRLLLVANKCDLPGAIGREGAIEVSAKTGAGLPHLVQQIVHTLVPEEPPLRAAVPVLPAQVQEIRRWRERLG